MFLPIDKYFRREAKVVEIFENDYLRNHYE